MFSFFFFFVYTVLYNRVSFLTIIFSIRISRFNFILLFLLPSGNGTNARYVQKYIQVNQVCIGIKTPLQRKRYGLAIIAKEL